MNMEQARAQMLAQQVRAWDVLDERVLDVLGSVPREAFVPPVFRELAFADTAIPLDHDQEMMAPKVEGRLLQALRVAPGERILEVGTGSGFLTACLARLGGHVTSIDVFEDFTQAASSRLEAHGIHNVAVRSHDLFDPTPPDREAFDVIAVTGSLPQMDERLIDWLRPGGRLFVIVGEPPVMEARLLTRDTLREWTTESLFETVVPALLNAPRPSPFRL